MGCVAEELTVGFVEESEDLASIAFLEDFFGREFLHLQSVHFLHEFLYTGKAGRHLFRNLDFHLHPIHFLTEAVLNHMLRIVRRIVDGDGGTHLVEVLDEHSFLVEVRDAERALHGIHSFRASPVLDRFQQGCRDICVVHELDPAEADTRAVPYLVGLAVDDAHDAAHHFSPLVVSHEGSHFAVLQTRIVLGVEPASNVAFHIRNIARIALVNLPGKLHKVIHLTFCLNGLNGAFHTNIPYKYVRA